MNKNSNFFKPENEPLNERCIYLRPLPGGCNTDIIIPFLRRSITKGWLNIKKTREKKKQVGGSLERKLKSRKRDRETSQGKTDYSWSKSRAGRRNNSNTNMSKRKS